MSNDSKTPKTPKRMDEQKLAEKYPHIVQGTLRMLEGENKQAVEIACVQCGEKRTVRTSDLFQVSLCEACKKAEKVAAKEAKAEAKKEAKVEVTVEAEAEVEIETE